MQLNNTSAGYGILAIVVHWVAALAIIGLFALGFWMVELSYYDDWYRQAPDIHRSVGVLLFILTVFRLLWRWVTVLPEPVAGHTRFEVLGARLAHGALYVLMFVAMISGYMITTADGSSVSVFGWFEVPSITGQVKGLEDTAGLVHYWSTWALLALAGVHGLAALKHHWVDRDRTLRRMLVPARRNN